MRDYNDEVITTSSDANISREALYKQSIILVRDANTRLKDAENQPPMEKLFGTLWMKGETTMFSADTGTGKTIHGLGIADAITKGKTEYLGQEINCCEEVWYYDLELSDKGFQKRYSNYSFSDKLKIITLNPNYLGEVDLDFESMINDMANSSCNLFIIDNLSAATREDPTDGFLAKKVMKNYYALSRGLGKSILVMNHVPKIPIGIPLHVNHSAGSKKLVDFTDSVFMMGFSSQSPNIRYIKQVKSRNAECMTDCIIAKIVNDDHLHFEYVGMGRESEHLVKLSQKIDRIDLISIFNGYDELHSDDIVEKLKNLYSFSEVTARRRIADAVKSKIIKKTGRGLYVLMS